MIKPLATICIPTTRFSHTIYDCLDSLEKQTNTSFRVILIVRRKSSTLVSQTKTYSFPLIIFKQKHHGLVGAMNDGLGNVSTDLFIRIDDDVITDKGWFNHIINPFSDQKVGAVTGPTLVDPRRLKERDIFSFLKPIEKNPLLNKIIIEYLYENRLYNVSTFLKSGVFTLGSNFKNHLPKKSKIVNNLEACNFALRTQLLKGLGGFDQLFSRGLGEYHEADIAFKIQEAGYQIMFHPQAIIHHNIKRGSSKTRSDAYHRIQNFICFYKRHFDIDTLDTLIRFSTNLFLQNCYYVYTGLKRKDMSQLGSIPGTLKGLFTTGKNI